MPIVLVAARQNGPLVDTLNSIRCAVAQVPTGALAAEWARDVEPDVIILDTDLPDMSGLEACRRLHDDLRISHTVPILILCRGTPTAEQRVAAVRSGAWDCIPDDLEARELTHRLEACIQAKRNIDLAFADGAVDPVTGLHSRTALARRAREMEALLARLHGGMACVVFAFESDPGERMAGKLLVRAARISDVVGTLSPTEFAVLAPATDQLGALRLTKRVARAVEQAGDGQQLIPGVTLWAGYDAIANLAYAPQDPLGLLARATVAVRNGVPEAGHPWVRRYGNHVTADRARSTGAQPASAPR